ncbi:MAG: metallophosphoesterase [Clostridium sp.]|nr:MAG: metallophosphoesterase [Clostridium sp.]
MAASKEKKMKKISKYLVGLSAILLLAGCGISIDNSNSNAIASSTIKESSGKPSSSSIINPSSSKNTIGSSTTNAQSELNILTINDTHGYLETSDSNSISKIATYMDSYDENALRISVGDMFQGTGLSNLTKGKAMIEVMNAMNIDAMVIGNHEFDWGIDTILGYFDGNEENGEAKFPLLAANVVDSDSKPLPNSSPYLITNKKMA